ncbi:unnamed protein product [Dovyalis caffra]|uniref:Uncharacterized protein n=1 Tax=Dovyalis caffra TaxID=77055 RepID=A0AAV1RUY3_9ROSI|nr:unnamed protein product [Dovyalis caffra]
MVVVQPKPRVSVKPKARVVLDIMEKDEIEVLYEEVGKERRRTISILVKMMARIKDGCRQALTLALKMMSG